MLSPAALVRPSAGVCMTDPGGGGGGGGADSGPVPLTNPDGHGANTPAEGGRARAGVSPAPAEDGAVQNTGGTIWTNWRP